ncbi:hypothetical protein B0H63DRAFT_557003 [Podospora didyma]|uniref:DUF6923 domain-containing protein n=1 Tax=Podospora didyma TaxID=330526 RepID=A0AAE0NYB7_9PEZI|nr:hypothetical protein B0H63DRAFT_557003 [Podospora didyma]
MHCLQSLFPLLAAASHLVSAAPNNNARAGDVVQLASPPMITETVPAFTSTVTTVTKAGHYTLAAPGCIIPILCGLQGPIFFAPAPTVTTVIIVIPKETTYPCATPTTFIKPSWDTDCGCTKTKTFWWTPRPCYPVVDATISVTTTTETLACLTEISTTTETSTSTSETSTSTSSSATPEPTLTCDKYGYLSQNTNLYRVDLQTGANTRITNTLSGETNAIGYNVLDNFLYGRQAAAGGAFNLVRISAAGTRTIIRKLDAGVTGNVGDIDTQGNYWLSAGGKGWWRIDLVPGSITYGQVLEKGTANALGYNIADWVYIPSGGRFLWAVGNQTPGPARTATLLKFNMDTKVWTKVRDYANVPKSTWGAQYGIDIPQGVLYASDNTSGEIWKFPIDGSAATKVTNGPKSGQNDGARCVLAPAA